MARHWIDTRSSTILTNIIDYRSNRPPKLICIGPNHSCSKTKTVSYVDGEAGMHSGNDFLNVRAYGELNAFSTQQFKHILIFAVLK